MAAKTIHYLAVFDDHTERPLYLGRQKRVATADQRLICHARDRGCTRPNCLESGYRCEVHHSPDWGPRRPHRRGQTVLRVRRRLTPWQAAASSAPRSPTAGDWDGRVWTGPPEINHVHHPDELLRGDPDPPEDEKCNSG